MTGRAGDVLVRHVMRSTSTRARRRRKHAHGAGRRPAAGAGRGGVLAAEPVVVGQLERGSRGRPDGRSFQPSTASHGAAHDRSRPDDRPPQRAGRPAGGAGRGIGGGRRPGDQQGDQHLQERVLHRRADQRQHAEAEERQRPGRRRRPPRPQPGGHGQERAGKGRQRADQTELGPLMPPPVLGVVGRQATADFRRGVVADDRAEDAGTDPHPGTLGDDRDRRRPVAVAVPQRR